MSDDICVADVEERAEESAILLGLGFVLSEPWRNAVRYVRGLLSDEEHKNSRTPSERAGRGTPDGMQRLLSTTGWNPDAVRDDLFTYVNRHLAIPTGADHRRDRIPQVKWRLARGRT